MDYINNNKTMKSMTSNTSVNVSNENLNSSIINSTKSLDEFKSDEDKKNKSIEEIEINEFSRKNSENSEFDNYMISEEFKNNEDELKEDFLFKRKNKKKSTTKLKQKNKFKDLKICYERQFTIGLNNYKEK